MAHVQLQNIKTGYKYNSPIAFSYICGRRLWIDDDRFSNVHKWRYYKFQILFLCNFPRALIDSARVWPGVRAFRLIVCHVSS